GGFGGRAEGGDDLGSALHGIHSSEGISYEKVLSETVDRLPLLNIQPPTTAPCSLLNLQSQCVSMTYKDIGIFCKRADHGSSLEQYFEHDDETINSPYRPNLKWHLTANLRAGFRLYQLLLVPHIRHDSLERRRSRRLKRISLSSQWTGHAAIPLMDKPQSNLHHPVSHPPNHADTRMQENTTLAHIAAPSSANMV
ncbi:hypothetical protein, partial [Azotobacter vinelandii]